MKKLLPFALSLLPAISLALEPQPATPHPPGSMADAFMMQLDSNKDGKVSKAEFIAPHEKRFSQMDKNGDGSVDRAEIEALEKAMRERMQQMRQQHSAPAGKP
ncbi:EF-hand domain-containing protein [Thiolapillus brandeum]|uniref:EF-hand domain-containing protein n=1 Tax=Thiolapillus brandeum TaxID=1076588 RepID=A0A7U6GLA8_9GAMM|nr:EF-hand domain-containing protein [Thiolapillus brandeum]BAO45735.1 conserved hypothetical protein [Thiolapillus brandeum]